MGFASVATIIRDKLTLFWVFFELKLFILRKKRNFREYFFLASCVKRQAFVEFPVPMWVNYRHTVGLRLS